MNYRPGDTVLVRGIVGRDGVVLGPGIEVGQACLNIIGDVPVFDQDKQPVGLMLFFATEDERAEFAALIDQSHDDVGMCHVDPSDD